MRKRIRAFEDKRRPPTMDRLIKRCSHSELELRTQHAFFSWFSCVKCGLRKMVQTYPHPKPETDD